MQQKFQIVLSIHSGSQRAVLRQERAGRTREPQHTDVGASVLARVSHMHTHTPAGWADVDDKTAGLLLEGKNKGFKKLSLGVYWIC